MPFHFPLLILLETRLHNWRCRNIVCAMRDLPMPGSPEINTTQPSHDYVLI